MNAFRQSLAELVSDLKTFTLELSSFITTLIKNQFARFEKGKTLFAANLYRQRGRQARRLMHSGMAGITALGVMVAPILAQEFPGDNVNPWDAPSPSQVLSATSQNNSTSTIVSEKMRGEVLDYTVAEGDTVGTIAEKFGVSEDTIRWQNDLTGDKIKVGQILKILPVTGISHKVNKGDTVYSIAKKYDSGAQAIVDFPYNTFVNDETFELAIGQTIIVPDGVMPASLPSGTGTRIRQITPDAGTVVANGSFVWPANGTISQRFAWYHKGVDIANRAAPAILAADSGKVIVAGWPDGYGYGNRVIIDHGNGYRTLYAHLSQIYVVVGQSVSRGSAIGQMGSTGRSTGTHLHFEVTQNGANLNPLNVLQ